MTLLNILMPAQYALFEDM